MAEFRIVNVGMDVTRTILEFTRDMTVKLLDGGIGVLDNVESKLPDIPFVSIPAGAGPAAYRALPPGRMRALPPGSAQAGIQVIPSQMIVQQPSTPPGVATRGSL